MSLLVRAALLGGLAYVVSRAVRNQSQLGYANRSDTARLSQTADEGDEVWPSADQPSVSKT